MNVRNALVMKQQTNKQTNKNIVAEIETGCMVL